MHILAPLSSVLLWTLSMIALQRTYVFTEIQYLRGTGPESVEIDVVKFQHILRQSCIRDTYQNPEVVPARPKLGSSRVPSVINMP